jgi:hypothetical protein
MNKTKIMHGVFGLVGLFIGMTFTALIMHYDHEKIVKSLRFDDAYQEDRAKRCETALRQNYESARALAKENLILRSQVGQ